MSGRMSLVEAPKRSRRRRRRKQSEAEGAAAAKKGTNPDEPYSFDAGHEQKVLEAAQLEDDKAVQQLSQEDVARALKAMFDAGLDYDDPYEVIKFIKGNSAGAAAGSAERSGDPGWKGGSAPRTSKGRSASKEAAPTATPTQAPAAAQAPAAKAQSDRQVEPRSTPSTAPAAARPAARTSQATATPSPAPASAPSASASASASAPVDDWDEQAGRLEQVAVMDNLPRVLESLQKWAKSRATSRLPTEVFFGSDACRLLLATYMRAGPAPSTDKDLAATIAGILAADVGAGLDRAAQQAAARLSMDGATQAARAVRASMDAVRPLLQTVSARKQEVEAEGGAAAGASKAALDAVLAASAGMLDASAGSVADTLYAFRDKSIGMGAVSGVVGDAEVELRRAGGALKRLGLDPSRGPAACLQGASSVRVLVARREALKLAASGHQAKAVAIQAAAGAASTSAAASGGAASGAGASDAVSSGYATAEVREALSQACDAVKVAGRGKGGMPGPAAGKAQAREEAARAEMDGLRKSLELELDPHRKKSQDAAGQLKDLRTRKAQLEAELAQVNADLEKQEARLHEAEEKMDRVGKRFMGMLREKEKQHRGLALQTHQQDAPDKVGKAAEDLAGSLAERVQSEATGRHAALIETLPTARLAFLESAACALLADAAALSALTAALAPSRAQAAALRQKVQRYRRADLGDVVATIEEDLEAMVRQLQASEQVLEDCSSHAERCFAAVQATANGPIAGKEGAVPLTPREVALCTACKQAASEAGVSAAGEWACPEADAGELAGLVTEGGVSAVLEQLQAGGGKGEASDEPGAAGAAPGAGASGAVGDSGAEAVAAAPAAGAQGAGNGAAGGRKVEGKGRGKSASRPAATATGGVLKPAAQGAVGIRWGKPAARAPVADIASLAAGDADPTAAGAGASESKSKEEDED